MAAKKKKRGKSTKAQRKAFEKLMDKRISLFLKRQTKKDSKRNLNAS
jgi:hypothetical protein